MTPPDRTAPVTLRAARPSDAPDISACAREAYAHYVARIGREPAPMLADYAEVIVRDQVHVAIAGTDIVGILVLALTPEGFCLDNIAVRPGLWGTGIGRLLLELAEREARRQGFTSIYLYTNEQMTEDRDLYRRIGYIEYARRVVDGYARVFFRKALA